MPRGWGVGGRHEAVTMVLKRRIRLGPSQGMEKRGQILGLVTHGNGQCGRGSETKPWP